MREISTKGKLYILTVIVVCSLVFYAVGIVTDLFASPMFSMFWIISEDTAHSVVTYAVEAIAIALSITALTIAFVNKQKTGTPKTQFKPYFRLTKTSNGAQDDAPLTNNIQKNTDKVEQNNIEKSESGNQPTTRLTEQATPQILIKPIADKNAANNIEDIKNKNKLSCPSCKKEFGQPLFVLDFESSGPRIVSCCPYCNKPLDLKEKDSAEEVRRVLGRTSLETS